MFVKKAVQVCCEPNCGRPRWALGRCGRCVKIFRLEHPDEVARLENLSREEQEHAFYMTLHQLPAPRWEWLGREDELIRICDQNSRRQVKVGASRTGQEKP